MISRECEAAILRLWHAERWKIGTIAAQLGVHHDTVHRVLTQAGQTPGLGATRPSMVEPFVPLIRQTLEQSPTLRASRLYEMVKQRGYAGGPDHFRHIVARYRPQPVAEAYLRLRTLPGEQAQVDWGHFGTLTIGRATRALCGFVMVLSYSRHVFLRFYLGQAMANFLRGHVAAFDAFAGVPRVLLYDNLKSAVLERVGQAIHFHPTLLELAAHYHFEPRPVAVARGNEKDQAPYCNPFRGCTASFGCWHRSRNRLPGCAWGNAPVSGAKRIRPRSSARRAASTPAPAKRLAVSGWMPS